MRISSGDRIQQPNRRFTMAKLVNKLLSILLQVIKVLLLVSRMHFCFYKLVYRLKLYGASFDDEVQSVVQRMVTKQSDLFMWIQVAVLLSYILNATQVFVYFIVQETHLAIPMAILCVDLWFQFGNSVLVCLWILVEMIGVGTVYYLIERKKMIRKMQLRL